MRRYILGTSVYTYPTARLLSFLMLVSLWAVYYKRDNIKKLVTITLLFFIALIPYFIFIVNNPGAITSRFRNISYLYSSISVIKKIAIFVYNVVAYWSPGFLIRYGDLNLRHSTGYGGVIFSITLFLFLLGLVNILFNKRLNKFNIFLLINLLLSPLAAILTSEGTPHALRSLLLGYYILLISCYGLGFILTVGDYYHRKILIACTLILLIFEVIGYQLNYFIFYPSISVGAMDSFDFKESLQIAIDQNPKEIIFVNNPPNTDKHLKFYSYLVENPKGIPIRMSEQPIPTLGSCVLYHQRNEEELNQFPYTFIEHENSRHLNLIERLFGVAPWYNMETVSIIKVRCYENSK